MINRYKIDELYYPHSLVSERHLSVVCPRHMHSSPEIVIVTKGVLNMQISNRDYTIRQGEGVFIPSFSPHSFDSPKYNECLVLTFAKELLAHIADFVKSRRVISHSFTLTPPLMALCGYYLEGERCCVDSILAQGILSPLFYHVLGECEFAPKDRLTDDYLLSALEYMNDNYEKELTLTDVAARIGMHPAALSASFTKRTGISFTHYLKYLRVSAAAVLIRDSADTFTAIALSSGFGTVRSFNRAFIEIYGITPGEYRKQNMFKAE